MLAVWTVCEEMLGLFIVPVHYTWVFQSIQGRNFENVAMKYNFINIKIKTFSVLLPKLILILWTRKSPIN